MRQRLESEQTSRSGRCRRNAADAAAAPGRRGDDYFFSIGCSFDITVAASGSIAVAKL